jgi:hypothetical protein
MYVIPAVLLIVFASHCCAEVKVFPSTKRDVRQYSTYMWLAPRIFTSAGMQENDPEYAPLIRQAVNRELSRKGYKEVEQDGELQVVSAAVSSKSSQLEGYLVTFGFDVFSGYYGPTTAAPITRVNREGALAISLYDPKLKEGVWSGYITEALGKPGNAGKKIDNAAAKLLKKLPEKK